MIATDVMPADFRSEPVDLNCMGSGNARTKHRCCAVLRCATTQCRHRTSRGVTGPDDASCSEIDSEGDRSGARATSACRLCGRQSSNGSSWQATPRTRCRTKRRRLHRLLPSMNLGSRCRRKTLRFGRDGSGASEPDQMRAITNTSWSLGVNQGLDAQRRHPELQPWIARARPVVEKYRRARLCRLRYSTRPATTCRSDRHLRCRRLPILPATRASRSVGIFRSGEWRGRAN